jgi:TPR repeat protein
MIQTLKQLLLVCAFLFALTGQARADLLSDAENAFDTGDYSKSAKLFRLLAEQGNPDAQINLGMMYFRGQGVPQDYLEAVKWYRLASKQGNAFAQLDLGMMYENGQGVLQDNTQAYKWLTIADANSPAGELKQMVASHQHTIEKQLTAEQIAEAKELARKCTANKFKGC